MKKIIFGALAMHLGTTLLTQRDENNLGSGLSLVPIPDKDYGSLERRTGGFSYLYKDGVKISNTIFRRGGLCTGFKGNYCMLIRYDNQKTNKAFFGIHCIVDINGKIVMESSGGLNNIYYLKGVIAVDNRTYFNLLTQKPIVNGYSSIKSENYLFVESGGDYEKGVYKISYETGEFEIFK